MSESRSGAPLGAALATPLAAAALGAINHLLAREAWARDRLAPFAGRSLKLEIRPVPSIVLRVCPDGLIERGGDDGSVDLQASLPAAALARLAGEREALLAELHIAGNAEFAAAVQFVARNLRWDAEDDLARVLGDIPARRLAQGASALIDWQRDAARRLAENVREYLTEENPTIATRSTLERFAAEVAEAAAALERLEARVAALEVRDPRR